MRLLRHIRLSFKTLLIVTIVICILLLFITVKYSKTANPMKIPSASSKIQAFKSIARYSDFFQLISEAEKSNYPPRGSWRKRRRKLWPTTNPQKIYTTDIPFTTMKYYTYVEDFLANWDKYPMTKAEEARAKDVHEAAVRLKNRKLFTEALTSEQKETVYDLLSSFDRLAKEEGIRYFAYGGTLLGSFRHHDLVPYDDDIDIIIDDNHRHKLRRTVVKSPTKFAMSTLSPDHYKLYNRHGTFTNLYHDWTYPYLDISFYKTNETHLYDLAMTYGRWWAYKIEDILPLHDRPLGPLLIPSPRDTYKYLVETYPNLSECSEGYYSHQLEMVIRCRYVSTACERLPYAFVQRSLSTKGRGVNESLVKDGQVLSWVIVQEPEYQAALSDPYTLSGQLAEN